MEGTVYLQVNVNVLIARELSGLGFTCTRSLTMNEKFSIPHLAASCGIEINNFSFIVSEFVKVNPDNSLAECVNIFVIQIEYPANKIRQILSQPKPWCNDSSELNLHHGYYTTIMTSKRSFRHSPVSLGINQPSENQNSYSVC